MRYLNDYYRERFGGKVYKLALDGGFTCPNRDGTKGYGGCIFCDAHGGGAFASERHKSLVQQLRDGKERVARKSRDQKYIAYFQAFTNTYAPTEWLRNLYTQALEQEEIVGLAIGTRPDCLGAEVLALLEELNRKKPISVELGLQTVHEETAKRIRRAYPTDCYFSAVKDLKKAGLEVVTHIILGLPGETPEMMVETTRQAVQAGTDGVKFHLLHVLRDTELERRYAAGEFQCMELEEYGAVLKACFAVLSPDTVVHRITGDGAKRDLVAPLWSGDKKRVLNYLNALLREQENQEE